MMHEKPNSVHKQQVESVFT